MISVVVWSDFTRNRVSYVTVGFQTCSKHVTTSLIFWACVEVSPHNLAKPVRLFTKGSRNTKFTFSSFQCGNFGRFCKGFADYNRDWKKCDYYLTYKETCQIQWSLLVQLHMYDHSVQSLIGDWQSYRTPHHLHHFGWNSQGKVYVRNIPMSQSVPLNPGGHWQI